MPVGHLHVLSGKMSIQFSCPFLNWVEKQTNMILDSGTCSVWTIGTTERVMGAGVGFRLARVGGSLSKKVTFELRLIGRNEAQKILGRTL